jgi:adenine-specific DNA-methyltransferase
MPVRNPPSPPVGVLHRRSRLPGRAPRNLAEVRLLLDRLRSLPCTTDPLAHARAIVAGALAGYWDETCAQEGERWPLARCPLVITPASAEHAGVASEAGRAAAVLPGSLAAYLLSSLYASLLPEAMRAEQGVFFTPPPLVERLLAQVERAGFDWSAGTVLDPAAGGGAFLAPVAERMERALRWRNASSSEILEHVAAHLAGYELDPFSAWMSHVFVESVLREHCVRAGRRLPVLTLVADTLHTSAPSTAGYDLVIGNPPYGRVTLSPELRARYARSLYGHANLYGVFTDIAVRLARPGGLIAYVTPTSFLGGRYFTKLRSFLAEAAPPLTIDFVEDRSEVFDGVLQETLLVVYGPGRQAGKVELSTIRPTRLDTRCEVDPIASQSLPLDAAAPWVLPRTRGLAHLTDLLSRTGGRLADYGVKVSTGPLVWNRHRSQLTERPGADAYPLVWAESILGRGVFRFQALRRNHKPFFTVRTRQEHLLQRQACILVQRTTAKEQRRRLIAALLPQPFLDEHGGAVVENHLNMVRPLNGAPRVSLEAIAALLNSQLVDHLFRCISGSVAVSAFELESLPVPSTERMRRVEEAVRSGAGEEEVEHAVRAAYGIAE